MRELVDREGARPDVFVAYADCGTGGALDAFLAEHPGIQRLPGAHCYEFFAGGDRFAALHDAEPGTFYLTDFLAKHFDALVWQGLGLDRHPALLTDVLRQLPPRRPAVAERRSRRRSKPPPPPPIASGSSSTTSTPGSTRSPPPSPSASTARSRDVPRQRNEVVVIMWRDIPAQVNGQAGRDRHQVVLDAKFQRAIDRAKRKARIVTAQEDVAQWRRVEHAVRRRSGAAAQDTADRLDAEYSDERLGTIAYNGGFE